MTDTNEVTRAPAAPELPRTERWLKRGTAIMTALAAFVAAIYGLGAAFSKFVMPDSFVGRLVGGTAPAATTEASVPAARCPAWQQSVASTFDREYQRHEGSGYSVVLAQQFQSAPQAQAAAQALSDEVWGRPTFPVAIRAATGAFVVGIGFNLTRDKATDLSGKMGDCYRIRAALLDPSVALRPPRKVVE